MVSSATLCSSRIAMRASRAAIFSGMSVVHSAFDRVRQRLTNIEPHSRSSLSMRPPPGTRPPSVFSAGNLPRLKDGSASQARSTSTGIHGRLGSGRIVATDWVGIMALIASSVVTTAAPSTVPLSGPRNASRSAALSRKLPTSTLERGSHSTASVFQSAPSLRRLPSPYLGTATAR